jgi:YVTN family beta-propeller protein
VTTIPVGNLPHGVWPSGDGSRIYVGLENDDALTAIDTVNNKVIATVPIGQAPQAIVYVPGAVPASDGRDHLQPLAAAGKATHLTLRPIGDADKAPTSVSLFDQGLVQVVQASVTGLEPKKSYVLALAHDATGRGKLEPLQGFTTNPAGAAIVNTIGPIRELVRGEETSARRYLVIAEGTPEAMGKPVLVQGPVESK